MFNAMISEYCLNVEFCSEFVSEEREPYLAEGWESQRLVLEEFRIHLNISFSLIWFWSTTRFEPYTHFVVKWNEGQSSVGDHIYRVVPKLKLNEQVKKGI